MSIVRGQYKQYVRPFARVVHGLLESWDPIAATLYLDDLEDGAVWSPCGRFIAVAKRESTNIFDAVTLNLLSTLESPPGFIGHWCLSFTPDGRFLTRFFLGDTILSWDIQTGGSLGTVQSRLSYISQGPLSLTYSMDGKMIAAVFEPLPRNHSYFVVIFDLFGTRIHTHHIPEGPIIPSIWTHGQCFRFATMKQSCITIWEVAFASAHGPTEVESLPAPDESADLGHLLFFPALSRLAFVLRGTIQIWDAKASKLLLKTETRPEFATHAHYPPLGSFSFDGHFFACIVHTGVHVWKESPSGYILHQKLAFNIPLSPTVPQLSPDGESIIISLSSTIQLWSTRDKILSSSDTPGWYEFVLGFSPNELFAGFVRSKGNVVKILDLQSGDLLLATDMDIEISKLWMSENTVVVVGMEGDIISWNLPGKNHTFIYGANIKDSIQTITVDHSIPPPSAYHLIDTYTSASPDLSRIVVPVHLDSGNSSMYYLGVYDVPTGRYLGSIETTSKHAVFTLDGHQIWDEQRHLGWEIVEDSRSGTVELKPLEHTTRPQGLFPFHSSRGYGVTDDGWVLSPARERLLWLPQRWRSTWTDRTWGGRFLALLHRELSDVVILEFLE